MGQRDVQGETGVASREHRSRSRSPGPLIGRDVELAELASALTARPALVLVTGEAGVGKSALVARTLAAPPLRSATVLSGACHRLREPFPLGPVLEALCGLRAHAPPVALSPVAGALAPLLPELADVLPPPPSPLGDPRAERHRIFRALRELLSAYGPLVCVLEDLHWADESTLEFLEFLARDQPTGLALMLTHRSAQLPSPSSLPAFTASLRTRARPATIELDPLSVPQVAELACALLGTHAISEELAAHLHAQTAGLPFALEEVVRLHRGQLELVDGWRTVEELESLGVPPAVRQSLRERMGELSDDAWLVTRAAAVLATPVDEDLVAQVAGLAVPQAIRALGTALAAAVLEERDDGRFCFLHALAAQAVYDEIPGPERRWLHRRAAEALQSGPEPPALAQLAHHFKEAGLVAEWTRYAEQAADAAGAIGDDRSAARLLEQALGAEGLEREAMLRIAVKLGTSALYSATPDRALALLERIRDDEPMDAGTRGELRYRVARLRYQTGDTGHWRREMARSVEELGDQPGLAARAMMTLASPVVGQGPVEHDLAWLRRMVKTAARVDDPPLRIAVAGQRAATLLSVGDPEGWAAAEEIPRDGTTVAERIAVLHACHAVAATAIGPGHFARAADFLDEVERLLDDLPHVSWMPWLESARAALDWRTGRWEDLGPRLLELTERGTGGPGLATGNEIHLAPLLLARGRIRDAEHRFRAILERAVARGWMGSRIAAASGLARILLARGDAAGALRAAASGLEVLVRKRIWIWGRELVPVAVAALLARGDRGGAAALAARFAAGVAGRDAPPARAAARLCDALLAEADGRHADGARHYAAAERISRRLPAPYEAAMARAGRGRCLLSAGDGAGVVALQGALLAFEELGAGWDATQVRAEFRTHDVPPPARRRGGRRPYGDELSPREAEVAQLAGAGRKNREIAEELFISQRTVETHVAAALRKLGAPSRDVLAEALAVRADERSVAVIKNP